VRVAGSPTKRWLFRQDPLRAAFPTPGLRDLGEESVEDDLRARSAPGETAQLCRWLSAWFALALLAGPEESARTWLPFVSRHLREGGLRLSPGGFGKWLIRRADVRGSGRSRWTEESSPSALPGPVASLVSGRPASARRRRWSQRLRARIASIEVVPAAFLASK
jgi:hypothetical protein